MKPQPAPDWRQTNPSYQESPARFVVINGVRCVEIDGGKLSDMAALGRDSQARGRERSA